MKQKLFFVAIVLLGLCLSSCEKNDKDFVKKTPSTKVSEKTLEYKYDGDNAPVIR